MDLKEFLIDIFPNKDEEKYTKMIDDLKSLGFDSRSDLKYLDDEAVIELDSFNRIEIKKLTDYLEKCARMDLKGFLLDVFPNKDEEKYTKMIDDLNSLGIDSMSDLKYLDEEAVKGLNSFNSIDIKRLTDYLAKYEFETLEDVLNEIFAGIPLDRIKEIKIFMNNHGIYLRRDILVIKINKLREEEFFSESELEKIESFLEKYNNEYYNSIMTEKELLKPDLIQALHQIFNGADTKRISEIEEILKRQDITAKKDLVYIDIDKFKKEKILSDIEISKIETFLEENYKEQFHKNKEKKELEKLQDLRHVLNEIFFGTPTNRLEEIEEILKEVEIYSGKDVLIADLNSLILQESLSSAEMLKFEEYLKKKNVGHYEKLMSDRELEKSKNLKYVLKQIFLDTPEERLEEIEKILKKERIYSGLDMKIIDTNDLRGKKSLPDIEILKIEEFIKRNNRERYDDIKAVKLAMEEKKSTRLKRKEDNKFYSLKQMEELKFMQLKAQEEQKTIEFKTEKEKVLREEEKELMKAKAKEEMEKEKMMVQREIELMEARTKNEMEKENMKLQREKLLVETRAKEEEIKMQRERELKEEKAKEMERLKLEIQREKESNEAKAKERMERETSEKCIESLINEKKNLLDDVRMLEKECVRLKNVITENSQTGIKGFFGNRSLEKNKAEVEYEERKESLNSRNGRITEIDNLLKSKGRLY